MKIVNFMPVHGRAPLLIHTINRLYRVNKVDVVVCAGDNPDDKAVCTALEAEWVYANNHPVSAKCNAALKMASKYDPDYIVMSFSSDWMSENWIPTMINNIGDADLIGATDCYYMNVNGSAAQQNSEWVHWGGYEFGNIRHGEPIGGGRILSRRICEALNWELLDNDLDMSLDASSKRRVMEAGGSIKCITDPSIRLLSISTDRWPNMHNFHDELQYPTSKMMTPEEINEMYDVFPESRRIFNK